MATEIDVSDRCNDYVLMINVWIAFLNVPYQRQKSSAMNSWLLIFGHNVISIDDFY